MFTGKDTYSLDAKGRLIIPAKYRIELGERFVMSLDLRHCINVYTEAQWNEFVALLDTLPKLSSPLATKLRLFYFSNAVECEPDGQGRVLIPAELRKFANLTKDVKVAGNNDHIEIWDLAAWQETNENIDTDELSAGLRELNL